MSIQENRKEVQVSREYNLLTSGKDVKPSFLNSKQHANKSNQEQSALQIENSSGENNFQQFGSVFNSGVASQNAATAPYQRNGNTYKQLQTGKSTTEEKKINEERQQKKNDYSEIQQILKSCTEQKGQQDQDDDIDDVEFEIVSYEDSSDDDDERSKIITEDENDRKSTDHQSSDEKKQEEIKIINAIVSQQPPQQKQQLQQQDKQIHQLGLRINTSSDKEDEHVKNESSEEDIFAEYSKVGQGYAKFSLPKVLQDINNVENHKKGMVAENQNGQSQQSQQSALQSQKDQPSSAASTISTFDKTRNKSALNKQNAAQQQHNQEAQNKTQKQRIQYCHQQLQQKRFINTRSSGAGSKGNVGYSASKSSYNNSNNTVGNDYQPKYISSRKRRPVTDPELESLGLLNKRRDNSKNNTRYYNEESETSNQDKDDGNDESVEETKKTKRRQPQQPAQKPKNTRNNETSHQKPQNVPAQAKKKAEQTQNAGDDEYPDVPITLPKDQQMELLKYHKRSKNYHGTAKQFGISHEEARVIVKKLKKEYRSIQNY